MIEHDGYCQPRPPTLVADKRSILPAAAWASVGLRMDTREAAVGGAPAGRSIGACSSASASR